MFARYKEIFDKALKPFIGEASLPADPHHGSLYDPITNKSLPFGNRGEQLIYFSTTGSSGYMSDGKYFDISGSLITEGEYNRIVIALGLEDDFGPTGKYHADDYWGRKVEK